MSMPLFSPKVRSQAEAIETVVYVNPFTPERIAAERRALGDAFSETAEVWNGSEETTDERENVVALQTLAERLARSARQRQADGVKPTPREAELYDALAVYTLYYRLVPTLRPLMHAAKAGRPLTGLADCYGTLVAGVQFFYGVGPDAVRSAAPDPAHLFACFFQILRAFDQILTTVVGTSRPAAALRAAIWQSIFTHDMRRYRRSLYDKTGDLTTLITGPSGTGKELVAAAVGTSRYVPFDGRSRSFRAAFADSFFPLNLSALSPTLVESELFGHRRGAFTGAVTDRKGWLQTCPPLGSVFLDEIGELDPGLQVKLLRVLQTRTFQPLGDTTTHAFEGKVIAATHRDLAADMEAGRFRQDFFYRLCSDVITTPSLAEQLAGSDGELRTLVRFIAKRLCPEEADGLTEDVLTAVERDLGVDYAWPGNFRELEQCVRNVMVRGAYRPAVAPRRTDLAGLIDAATLTADDLLARYCAHVYRLTGSYEAAGRRLKMDRRTVRAHVERANGENAAIVDFVADRPVRRR